MPSGLNTTEGVGGQSPPAFSDRVQRRPCPFREKGEGPEEGVLPHLTVPAMSRRSGLKTGESFYY